MLIRRILLNRLRDINLDDKEIFTPVSTVTLISFALTCQRTFLRIALAFT